MSLKIFTKHYLKKIATYGELFFDGKEFSSLFEKFKFYFIFRMKAK